MIVQKCQKCGKNMFDEVVKRFTAEYKTPEPTGPLHHKDGESAQEALRTIHEVHSPYCEDPECMVCGVLSCPRGEPMHFHHDGCPADCGS